MYESYTNTQSSSPRSPHELMAFRHSENPNIHSSYTMHAGQYSPGRYQMSDPVSSDDDSWTKEAEEINNQRRERPLRREILSFEGASEIHERGYDGVIGVDSSEALGHQLRRQRLAQSPSKKYVPDYMVPHYEEKPSVDPAPLSPGPFRRSKMMNTTDYSPSYTPPTYSPTSSSTTSSRLRKPGSKKSRPREKHVVFSEPVSASRFQAKEEVKSVEKALNSANYGYFFHTAQMSDPIAEIYSDLESPERRQPVNRSFSSSGESSVFDDVALTSNMDTALGQITTYAGRSSPPKHKMRTSFFDDEGDQSTSTPRLFSVTVNKRSKTDKIGIYVHRETFSDGRHRLVVSKVAPDGKFANTRIKEGDVVVSINGQDMTEDPTLERALAIVSAATDSVTIVAFENPDVDDSMNDSTAESAVNTSIISSISKDQSSIAYSKGPMPKRDKNAYYFAPEFENEKYGAEAAAKNGAMTMDGSMLITRKSEVAEPYSIQMNESWKISGVMVINVEKKSFSIEDTGLDIAAKKTASGNVLYVADIRPTSVFVRTPLRRGDIIISINSVGFFDNADVPEAYAALRKQGKRLTLVAKKGEKSLNDFLLNRWREADLPQTKSAGRSVNSAMTSQTSGSTRTSSSEGSAKHMIKDDNQSHKSTADDNSMSSRQSNSSRKSNAAKAARRITILKKTPNDSIGLDVTKVETKWGAFIAISKIIPGSKASSTELKVGDIILSVNDISFRTNPDVAKVISLVREARGKVCIEIQKLSSFPAAAQVDLNRSLNESIEAEETEKSVSMNKSGESARYQTPSNSFASHVDGGDLKQRVPKKRQKVLVTVTKDRPAQKIGLDFALLNDKLVVTDINPKGLLRNAPLVYGDTILSINGVSFRNGPVAKQAYDIIRNARKKVTIELLKVEYYDHRTTPKNDESGVSSKSCIPSFMCRRRRKVEHKGSPTKL